MTGDGRRPAARGGLRRAAFDRLRSLVVDNLLRASHSQPALAGELSAFSALLQSVEFTPRGVVENHVPGLRHLPAALALAEKTALRDTALAVRSVSDACYWSAFYAEDAWTRGFLNDFANGELVGPSGPIPSADVILGAFVMGPETLYPAHAHPAREFYLVLAGRPAFQIGGGAWRVLPAGTVSFHGADVAHAIRTGADPMLAIFGWRGDLNAPSWYETAAGERRTPPRLTH